MDRVLVVARRRRRLCFIGHGAFGFITKAAWVPYFGVVGIPEAWAWRLMPLVGAVNVMVGMAVLFAPRGLPLVYMTMWAVWTALLRPLSGDSVFETLERAGNYGVPFALLLLTAMPRSWRGLTMLLDRPAAEARALDTVRQRSQVDDVCASVGPRRPWRNRQRNAHRPLCGDWTPG